MRVLPNIVHFMPKNARIRAHLFIYAWRTKKRQNYVFQCIFQDF